MAYRAIGRSAHEHTLTSRGGAAYRLDDHAALARARRALHKVGVRVRAVARVRVRGRARAKGEGSG